jgi:diguanylate cyclase (GGDEF)-like protein
MRILVAEDEITYRHMLKTLLTKWGYEVAVASNGLEAWEALQRDDRPRLAILDWMMPGMDGVEICRAIRQGKADPYIYLLLLTSRDQKQDMVQGFEAGADDYLIKPFDPHELRARVHAGERIVELQDRLIRVQEALREQATHDPLTGVLNRRACLDSLLSELNRGGRSGSPVCICMADIDYFKRVNDAHGHLAGDEVLREVARRMQNSLRGYDAIGRFGGEEFLLVLPGCSIEEGVKLAERICHVVRSEPVKVENWSFEVSISLGVAVAYQPAPRDMEALLGSADAALYRAKEAGRNRVEFSTQLRRPSSEAE